MGPDPCCISPPCGGGGSGPVPRIHFPLPSWQKTDRHGHVFFLADRVSPQKLSLRPAELAHPPLHQRTRGRFKSMASAGSPRWRTRWCSLSPSLSLSWGVHKLASSCRKEPDKRDGDVPSFRCRLRCSGARRPLRRCRNGFQIQPAEPAIRP